ncbi:F-box domain-containing protein [Medusavirus stheno T3]|uniref:F-box domain-containing protein n=1 Tax=Medusavirus stheno T3 TaxID=3069717 RepID=A0A7S7YEC6_9VIRU|nr:F-box domain-containing protein [Acanthamoeba castellanii medusavirus]QPB44222.1 F-box domain-containing protein [Medusavirus stheno T3]
MNKRKHDAPQPTAAKMRKTDDPDGDLPNEIYLHIMSFLPARDLGATCTLVSRGWNELSRTRSLWKRILIQRHPEWYGDLSHMNVNFVFMSARERLRLLEDRHDPAERRADCCEHNHSRGAGCRCCTCRHHRRVRRQHRGDGRAFLPVDPLAVPNLEEIMAMTYDAEAAKVPNLHDEQAQPMSVEPMRGLVSTADSIATLQNMGWLRTWMEGDGSERVAWTEKAHQAFKPPLFSYSQRRVSVSYSDAELIARQVWAKEDFSDVSIEQDRGVLCWCRHPIHVDELHRLAAEVQPHLEQRAEFERVVLSLQRTGWITSASGHVEWSRPAERRFGWPAKETYDGHLSVLFTT